MKTVLLTVLSALLFVSPLAADTYVNGYYRKDGTYVQPHYRSDTDSSKENNWSSWGNTNPYTGEKGYKKDSSFNFGSGLQKPKKWGGLNDIGK